MVFFYMCDLCNQYKFRCNLSNLYEFTFTPFNKIKD